MTQMKTDSTQYSEKLAMLKSLMDELARGMFPDKDSKFLENLQIHPDFVPPKAWAYTPETLVRYLYTQLNNDQLSEKDRIDYFINFISYGSNFRWLQNNVNDNPLISATNKQNLHAIIDDMINFNVPNRTPSARIEETAPPQTIKETLTVVETIRNFFKGLFIKKDKVESEDSLYHPLYDDTPSDLNAVHTTDVPIQKVGFVARLRNFFAGLFKKEVSDEDTQVSISTPKTMGKLNTSSNLEYEEPLSVSAKKKQLDKEPLDKSALQKVKARETNSSKIPNTDTNDDSSITPRS
ncbi:MAG: hypothetical protein WC627_10660 [Legionella sp.]|jgi:hypothetical protein